MGRLQEMTEVVVWPVAPFGSSVRLMNPDLLITENEPPALYSVAGDEATVLSDAVDDRPNDRNVKVRMRSGPCKDRVGLLPRSCLRLAGTGAAPRS